MIYHNVSCPMCLGLTRRGILTPETETILELQVIGRKIKHETWGAAIKWRMPDPVPRWLFANSYTNQEKSRTAIIILVASSLLCDFLKKDREKILWYHWSIVIPDNNTPASRPHFIVRLLIFQSRCCLSENWSARENTHSELGAHSVNRNQDKVRLSSLWAVASCLVSACVGPEILCSVWAGLGWAGKYS